MSAKELADIYNYLTIACGVDAKNMPVSTTIVASLSHMINWVRTAMELPMYETEEDALKFLKELRGKVPACFTPDTQMPKFEVPILSSIPKDLLPGTYEVTSAAIEKLIEPSVHHAEPQEHPVNRAQERELAAQRKDKVVGLIEEFTEKKDAEEIDELVDNITKKDLYK